MRILFTPLDEKIWVCDGKVLSVVARGFCQFGDVVEHDNERILRVTTPGHFELFHLHGPPTKMGVAMEFANQCAKADLHVEVWSLTMVSHAEREKAAFHAGLARQTDLDHLECWLRVRHAARSAGITVGAPLLAQAAGDDLAAWQGRVLAKRWAA